MSLSKLSLFLLFSLGASQASAAGYALIEQSVTGLGRAFSGSAAVADDASTIFFNPAGMAALEQREMALGLNYIAPTVDFDNADSSLPDGSALTGADGGDPGENAILPNLYYVHPLGNGWTAGIGITSPFGLVTDYHDNWIGRYHARKSDLKTVNINPSIAFQATEKLALGAGISLQYADIELSQAVDFGAAIGQSQMLDGQAKVLGDDWAWGFNLGLTYQFTPKTRLGLSYRSKIKHDLEGDGKFRIPSGAEPIAAAGGAENGKISGSVTLPEIVSLALHHQFNSNWAIMADATWTRWSRFDALIIDSPVVALNSEKTQDWDDTMRYGIGIEYTPGNQWQWRAGIAYDETPVPDSTLRTPRIPDQNRKWLAFGATYSYNENIKIDAAYAHLFVSDSHIDDVNDNGYRLNGTYQTHIDLFAVQMRWILN
ncbi:Long-chain fatty acid transport protein [Methylophaga frappieri]|uniref:Long-chain fatty acid transport protein n=1 Tax=Methylophaga frappieri (strain ATCC BAA-2434 / DSM 25690 / JAM7) TaxID=754477 RepID=I1YL60_METFJ|nr:OmpP1/FadL family transporter [Methylophaga frappieri]AFJ03653.1 Long-chain fatty acid transport protein [Methylophaga frappieri]